jgi:hypothetical protein
VIDDQGRDLRKINWYNGHQLAKQGIYAYHYSLVFPQQVREKSAYYRKVSWARREKAQQWVDESFMQLKHPFRVHNVYFHFSWLERAEVNHPEQIQQLIMAIESGQEDVELRNNVDAERLLDSNWYKIVRALAKAWVPIDRFLWRTIYVRLTRLGRKLLGSNRWQALRLRILGRYSS